MNSQRSHMVTVTLTWKQYTLAIQYTIATCPFCIGSSSLVYRHAEKLISVPGSVRHCITITEARLATLLLQEVIYIIIPLLTVATCKPTRRLEKSKKVCRDPQQNGESKILECTSYMALLNYKSAHINTRIYVHRYVTRTVLCTMHVHGDVLNPLPCCTIIWENFVVKIFP